MADEGTANEARGIERTKRAVAFDMDGVLVDSEGAWVDCVDEFLSGFGARLSEQDRREAVGCSYEHMVATICRIVGGDPAEMEAQLDAYLQHSHFAYTDLLIPGAQELLRDLHRAKVPVAISSSSLEYEVDAMLDQTGLRDFVDLVVNADMVKAAKPSPDIYERTVELLGVPREQVVVVEDSAYGVQAAEAAGVTVIQLNRLGVPRMDGVAAECADYDELKSVLAQMLVAGASL
jgi:beta-phosphoglucomutase